MIYSYIYSKGFDKIVTHINVGELQRVSQISNVGLRKNLQLLEKGKYLLYKEYDRGMYTIKVLE